VPYKGAGLALPDVVAGRIQVFVGSVTASQTLVSQGRVRGIATGHIKRLRSMPDMPTVGEAFPGFSNDGWYGIVAPVRTPPAVINKLNAELRRALGNAEFSKHIETIGMEPNAAASSTPKELGDWIRSELERWSKVVRDAGVQVQGGAAG
jgi:tripartite-type tricarboxylate transporter receptor subunit TctC